MTGMVVCVTVGPIGSGGVGKRERERHAVADLLSGMLGRQMTIGHTSDGAPFIEECPDLFVSVSHCIDAVAVAVSRQGSVGIDIERPSPRLARVIARVMRDDEPACIDPLRAWTAKEAVFKCAGVAGMVLSDIRLDARAEYAVTADGSRFAVCHCGEGIALAVRLPRD